MRMKRERVHGTHATYLWELRHGLDTCEACRAGHAAYLRSKNQGGSYVSKDPREDNSWPRSSWKPSAGLALLSEV